MAARKRKAGESFEDYRASLKYEALPSGIRHLVHKFAHKSIEFFKDVKKNPMKRSQTFRDGRNARKRAKKLSQQYAKRG